jgi:hypothetical protein
VISTALELCCERVGVAALAGFSAAFPALDELSLDGFSAGLADDDCLLVESV